MAAPSKRKRFSKTKNAAFKRPPLTSLIDTVTIIMFYLMTQMGSSAVTNPMVGSVPNSDSKEGATKGVTFGLDKTGLYLERTDINTNETKKEMLADPATMDGPDLAVPRFQAVLEQSVKVSNAQNVALPNLTVQIDSMITYQWVLKLMNTASALQFKKVDIIVVNPTM